MQQLVQAANDNGGRDNISAMLIRIAEPYRGAARLARAIQGTIPVIPKDNDHGQADSQRRRAGAQGVQRSPRSAPSSDAKPHNDIQIDNLAVSGEHAAIITILNDSFIEDLGSTNGTMVNGKPIKKHFLQNNDVVEIGKHKLKYFNDAPTAATAADFEKTMIIRNPAKAAPPRPAAGQATWATRRRTSSRRRRRRPQAAPAAPPPPAAGSRRPPPPPPPPAAAAPAPAPRCRRRPGPCARACAAAAGTPLREAAIQVLSGAAAGRTLDLTKNLTTIGKPGLQVAVITKRPNGYFITHVEGATFPTLNGASLGGAGTSAERPRPDRDRGREDGVLLQAVSAAPGGELVRQPRRRECAIPQPAILWNRRTSAVVTFAG